MNDYQIRFLKQSVLGQRVKMNRSDEVILRCIELADRDMMSGGRFVCGNFTIKTNKERVAFMLRELTKGDFEYRKIDKKSVCNTVFWQCDKEKTISVKGRDRIFKPFGLAQKLVNMTFKYLYTFRDHIGREIDFSQCECPVDSVILEKLGRNEKWTNITFAEYEDIRTSIDRALEDDQYAEMRAEIGALAFDDNWVNSED